MAGAVAVHSCFRRPLSRRHEARPRRLAWPIAAVSFSGRFDDDAPDDPVTTPVLLVHGERDAVIPFAESDVAQRALAARGAKVERLDRPAMGHSIDAESLNAAVAFLARSLGAR